MREHRYSLSMPHPPARVWALMQDYPRWTGYAPMVLQVQGVYPGDERGNGRLRRVIYRMPFGRRGLEPGGSGTRLHFEERFHVESPPWSLVESPVHRFSDRQNEASMRALSDWLGAHPEYRPELAAR